MQYLRNVNTYCIFDYTKLIIYRLTITNTDKQHGACALKWNTMMDDMYWASAVEMWKGDENLSYSKPVIPLHQSITQTDYEYFGKS